MIAQPDGVPVDGTNDDCIAPGPVEAVDLALSVYAEQFQSISAQGASAGDEIAIGSPYTPASTD